MTEYNDTTNVPATDVGAATLALARKAGWTIDRSVTFALPPEHWAFHYVPAAELLLLPVAGSHAKAFAPTASAVRQARSDAIIVSLGHAASGERQVFASICMWSSMGVICYGPHLPWLSPGGDLWLVPDPRARVDEEPSFLLTMDRLIPKALPATNDLDRRRGLVAARQFFNAGMEG